MTDRFADAMRQALVQTRAFNLKEATGAIMTALGGQSRNSPSPGERPEAISAPGRPLAEPAGKVIDGDFREIDSSTVGISDPQPAAPRRHSLGDVVKALRRARAIPGLEGMRRETEDAPPIPAAAKFVERSFSCAAGARSYRLYVPARLAHAPRGLVLMLHGCTQDAGDFAKATNMNAVAEMNGLLVVYPTQTKADNPSACWNWFRPGDQRRDGGEPAILADLTRVVASEFGLAADRVFVAGLSAGGAMAAILAQTYPDLFSAVGVHSGLPCGSAHDLVSAFAAMRGERAPISRPADRHGETGRQPAMIVFHGSADRTVHPANAEHLAGAATAGLSTGRVFKSEGHTAGRNHRTTITTSEDGAPLVELWLIDGAGHAWSGGHPSGSFADPSGPDASVEMVRFFLQTLDES